MTPSAVPGDHHTTTTNLAQQILDRITAEPSTFHPGLPGFISFLSHAVWPEDEIDGRDVTLGLAGWACHLSGWRLSVDDFGTIWAYHEDLDVEQRRDPIDLAVELLGLDGPELLRVKKRGVAVAWLGTLARLRAELEDERAERDKLIRWRREDQAEMERLRAELATARAAADQVRELHEPLGGTCGVCADDTGQAATAPCDTLQLLTTAPAVCTCGAEPAHQHGCPAGQ